MGEVLRVYLRYVIYLVAAILFATVGLAEASSPPGTLAAPARENFGKSVFGVTGAFSPPRNVSIVNSKTGSTVTGLTVAVGGTDPGDNDADDSSPDADDPDCD